MGRPPGSRNKTEAGTDIVTLEPPTKSVLIDMSNRYGMEPAAFEATVRSTCMRPDKNGRIPTREEFAAFLLVAKEYNLNPLTKEIYAYASKGGGIVPIVSVDGWVNLVNSHGQCDGFEFDMEHGTDGKQLISCTCRLYRKDRSHPTTITEYFSECVRDTDPWKMKHRMLRHKALIQAARYAFGFSGIYDEDEGQKIAEIDPNRDAAPPRTASQDAKQIEPPRQASTAPEPGPGEDHAAGEVQDGAPPRRAPKPAEAKADPITSGPQRAAPDTVAEEVKPHRISGNGLSSDEWAKKYQDLIKTSADIPTLYRWIDENSRAFTLPGQETPQAGPLTRLAKLKPSLSAQIKKTTEQLMDKLRDAQEKAARKNAKPKPAEPPADDMSDDAPGDMDDGTAEESGPVDYGKPADDNPETILKWIDGVLATAEDPADIEVLFEKVCQQYTVDMIPPDQDEAAALVRKHEKRLEP